MVHERTASRTVRPRDLLLARVLDLGDRAILAGCHLRSLPPLQADEARRRVRSHLGARAAKVKPEQLHESSADETIFRIWQEVVDAADARPAPQLQNTDGEDFIFTTDRFEVAAGREDEVLARLMSLPDASRDEEEAGGEGVTISFVREGNAKGLLPTTLVGRATVEGRALRLETNSRERADSLRSLVAERLGPLVSFRIRDHADPLAGIGKGRERGDQRPPEPMPPEVLGVVKRMQAEHYQRWLDEAIPALGGLTPRQAAGRKGGPRQRVELLLAEIEHAEAGQPVAQRFDVAVLRRELGLDVPKR